MRHEVKRKAGILHCGWLMTNLLSFICISFFFFNFRILVDKVLHEQTFAQHQLYALHLTRYWGIQR